MKNSHLLEILKPVRYAGGEWNAVRNKTTARLRFVLAYPDVYEIGMSYLGLHVLYDVLNRREDIWCERTFAPWSDREAQMRQRNETLTTLESGLPVSRADILGMSFQHELTYTNALLLLDLAGLPLCSRDRNETHPLVIAGGPCAFNPAPMAPFIDAFVIGEAEEGVLDLADSVLESKKQNRTRLETLLELSKLEGVFVPSLYSRIHNRLGELCFGPPLYPAIRRSVRKRLIDFENHPYPVNQTVPNARIVQRRVALEIMRGCTRGCRFCQAGFVNRPLRERSVSRLIEDAMRAAESTGYDELSLLSLSSGDYSRIRDLVSSLMDHCESRQVSVSLPSLRLDGFAEEIPRNLERVRGGGLTFAPEAGTERLRRAVNKAIPDATILDTIRQAMTKHWESLKLYFMIGLPTETEEDIAGIGRLVARIHGMLRGQGWRRGTIHVSIGTFSPKPHTPYQWCGQISTAVCADRLRILRSDLRRNGIKLSTNNPEPSLLEAILARGDIRLAGVIELAFRAGCRFDEWFECFRWDLWQNAFRQMGLRPESLAEKTYRREDLLPWSVIDIGVRPEYLWHEYRRTFEDRPSDHCGRDDCRVCGVCDGDSVRTIRSSTDQPLPQESAPVRQEGTFRYRLKYAKHGPGTWLSHHDLLETMNAIFRRAGVTLAFSQGFHPHPKITFAGALPVGLESWGEYLEVSTVHPCRGEKLCADLSACSPEGIEWIAAVPVEKNEPKIGSVIRADELRISWKDGGGESREPSEEALREFNIGSWLPEENSVRLIVVHSEGNPPQIRKILSGLQEQGVVPCSSRIERLDQHRKDGDHWTPVVEASRSLA